MSTLWWRGEEYPELGVDTLLGKTLVGVDVNEDKDVIEFTTDDGSVYRMFHDQGCCEDVRVEDIEGDLQDLIGSPIILAEESTSEEAQPGQEVTPYTDSFTWTFYRLATARGFVSIRWYGESNGFYSESVSFIKTK